MTESLAKKTIEKPKVNLEQLSKNIRFVIEKDEDLFRDLLLSSDYENVEVSDGNFLNEIHFDSLKKGSMKPSYAVFNQINNDLGLIQLKEDNAIDQEVIDNMVRRYSLFLTTGETYLKEALRKKQDNKYTSMILVFQTDLQALINEFKK